MGHGQQHASPGDGSSERRKVRAADSLDLAKNLPNVTIESTQSAAFRVRHPSGDIKSSKIDHVMFPISIEIVLRVVSDKSMFIIKCFVCANIQIKSIVF